MNNIENVIKNAGNVLKKQNIQSYNLDAEILLAKVLKKKREYLITNLKKKINDRELAEFNKLLRSRELTEPIAYITKKKDFWNSRCDQNNEQRRSRSYLIFEVPHGRTLWQNCMKNGANFVTVSAKLYKFCENLVKLVSVSAFSYNMI